MKNYLLITLITLLSFSITSCKDDEDVRPDCEINNTGDITITNSMEDPYSIYFNGTFYRVIESNASSTFSIVSGSYRAEAVQADGYILSPTRRDVTIFMDPCAERTWIVK
jgi:hypothetical protein